MTIVNNNSVLANITFDSQEKLYTFKIIEKNIAKFIRPLDPNKAHPYDDISICRKKHVFPISKHWQVSFRIVLRMNISPNNGKKLK